MKYRTTLEQNLKMRGSNIEPEVIDFFYQRPQPISQEDFSMYFNYLKVNLQEMHRNYYGKSLEDMQTIKDCIKSIVRSYRHLSGLEIRYCMRSIVAGLYTMNKYAFNTADLLQVLKIYSAKKNLVKSTYFTVKRSEERAEEDKVAEQQFIQQALRKMDSREHLTIYERSAIGKHLSDQISADLRESARERSEEDLPQKIKELSRIRNAGGMLDNLDPEMNTPIAWSSSLLYGELLFNLKYPDYV